MVIRRLKKRPFIIDKETKNLSFLQTSYDLYRLGIKNHDFFLRLYNPKLQGIDPHSPFLTKEQKEAIIIECTINPWYFLREVSRIPDQGGKGIPYQLHRANLAMTFLFLSGIDSYMVIPRQKGKTQSALAIILWAYLFGTSNSEIMFMNKQHEDAVNNLMRLKAQRDLLPPYMQSKEIINEEGRIVKEKNNVKSIINPIQNNKIVTKPSAKTKESALSLGRGNTQPIQYFDEVEFTPYIYTILMAAAPAYKTASAHSKRNGAVHGRIFTTTPGDLDTQPAQDALKILSKTCKWTEKMYDMTKSQLQDYLDSNAKESGIVYVEYNYKQLGEGEEWLNEMSKLLMYDQVVIRREIHLQRINGSNNSPFSMEDLMAINDLKRQPIREEIVMGKYKLDIYKEVKKKKFVVIGIDTSTGIGKDNNAITVVDPDSLEPIAEFKSPYMSSVDLRKFVYILAKKYYPVGIIVPERNMGGYTLVDELLQTDIGHRIYYENVQDITKLIDDRLDEDGFLKREAANRKIRGVYTTGKSRELMMKILRTHVEEHKEKFITQNIIEDLNNLVLTRTGKVEAARGQHDDSIMSYLMALYVIYYGKNLTRFGYVRGINTEEKEFNSGLIYDENTLIEELERMTGIESDEFTISFKTGSKDMDASYDEYQKAIEQARKKMNVYNDPYIINQAINMQPEEEEFSQSSSIPLSLFDELNS